MVSTGTALQTDYFKTGKHIKNGGTLTIFKEPCGMGVFRKQAKTVQD